MKPVRLVEVPVERRLHDMRMRFERMMADGEVELALGIAADVDRAHAEHNALCRWPERSIEGVARTKHRDANHLTLDLPGCMYEAPVPLLFEHKRHDLPIGEVYRSSLYENRIYCRAVIFHTTAADFVWRRIEAGTLNGFSVSVVPDVCATGKHYWHYHQWRLREISVVADPADREARFIIANKELRAA
jgi:hypothetical protein